MGPNDTESKNSHVGKAIAKGAIWTVSLRMTGRSIGVVSTLILARLLTPEDFGIYALAMTVYAFVELLSAFGFGYALIQNQDATDSHYNTAWTLQFLFSLVTATILFTIAPYASTFFGEPQLTVVMRFLCILFLLNGLKNIGVINFQKHMTFNLEFRYSLLIKLAGFLVTIPLAFLLRSYWAMLWGLLASSLMMLTLSYGMQSFRPRLQLDRWREMISFSFWLQINNILFYLTRHTEKVLVSQIGSVATVGSLQLAREIGNLLGEVVQPINRAVFPGYSKVNNDRSQMLRIFCDVNGVLLMIGFPVSIGLFSIAHLFVPTVLGDQWLDVIPLMKWLALASLIAVGASSTNNVMIALAKMKWSSAIVAFNLAWLIGFMLWLLPRYGVMGVAFAAVSSSSLTLFACYYALRIHINLKAREIARIAYRPAIASLVMSLLISELFPAHWTESGLLWQLLQLTGAIFTGAICYCIVLCLLWWLTSRPVGPELKLLRLVHERSGFGGFLLPKGQQNA